MMKTLPSPFSMQQSISEIAKDASVYDPDSVSQAASVLYYQMNPPTITDDNYMTKKEESGEHKAGCFCTLCDAVTDYEWQCVLDGNYDNHYDNYETLDSKML